MTDIQRAQLYQTLGTRIRQARERLKLSQGALANRLPISRISLVNIEKGQQHTPLHILLEIAYVLDVTLISLIPSPEDVFGSKEGLHPSRLEKIEQKTADSPESREHVKSFVRKVISRTEGKQ